MKQKPFNSMKGSELMEFVRDALLDEAARKRGFIDDCERVAGGVTPPEDRQRVRTLEAAGEMLTYVISLGQEEKQKCDKDPARRFPDWIWRLSSELRRLLVAEEVDPEHEAAG
jgi:hypothetical protein